MLPIQMSAAETPHQFIADHPGISAESFLELYKFTRFGQSLMVEAGAKRKIFDADWNKFTYSGQEAMKHIICQDPYMAKSRIQAILISFHLEATSRCQKKTLMSLSGPGTKQQMPNPCWCTWSDLAGRQTQAPDSHHWSGRSLICSEFE